MKAITITVRGSLFLSEPGSSLPPGRYTFQKVAPGLGNVPGVRHSDLQMRRTVIPADPQTPAQLARRAALAAAVAAWHAAPPEDREQYRPLAARRQISLFNAWISAHL